MARAEVEALTGRPAVPVAGGLVGVPGGDWQPLRRLGYGRAVLRCLGRSDTALVPFDPSGAVAGSFAVRVHHLEHAQLARRDEALGAHQLAARIGGQMWRRLSQPRVHLDRPDTEIHVFITTSGFWWGRRLYAIDGRAFTARRPNARPFWRSIAMSPRKARCLVNLSGVQPGGTLLDPFCGTGSIPIEAALLGVRTCASDVDAVVVRGAACNFASLALDQQIALNRRDARAWSSTGCRFDAIVSDLPYGRSASTKGSDRDDLYRSFLEVAAEVLTPGGRAVLIVAEGSLPAPPPALDVVARFLEVVHKSLTREVVVLQETGNWLSRVEPP